MDRIHTGFSGVMSGVAVRERAWKDSFQKMHDHNSARAERSAKPKTLPLSTRQTIKITEQLMQHALAFKWACQLISDNTVSYPLYMS